MTGIEILRDYARSLKDKYPYDKVRIEAIADQIERETLPRPLFEDGEPVQLGDRFVAWDGKAQTVDAIEFFGRGWTINSSSADNFVVTANGRNGHGTRVKRQVPEVEGTPVEQGQRLFLTGQRAIVEIKIVDGGKAYDKDGNEIPLDEAMRELPVFDIDAVYDCAKNLYGIYEGLARLPMERR